MLSDVCGLLLCVGEKLSTVKQIMMGFVFGGEAFESCVGMRCAICSLQSSVVWDQA